MVYYYSNNKKITTMRKHSFFAVMGTVAAIVGLFVGTVAYAATPTFSL
jgi:hypothetical protein